MTIYNSSKILKAIPKFTSHDGYIFNVATFLGKKFYFEVFRMVAKKNRKIYSQTGKKKHFPLIKL